MQYPIAGHFQMHLGIFIEIPCCEICFAFIGYTSPSIPVILAFPRPGGSRLLYCVSSDSLTFSTLHFLRTVNDGPKWLSNFVLQIRLVRPLVQFGSIMADRAKILRPEINFTKTRIDSGP